MRVAGDSETVRDQLVDQLQEAGISTDAATSGADAEQAVTNLVGLARDNGFCVEMADHAAGSMKLQLTKPGAVRMLQSGHHQQRD